MTAWLSLPVVPPGPSRRAGSVSALLLAALLAASGPASPAGMPREVASFGSNPGNLRMFGYLPEGTAPGAALIVVLHGCKQSAAAFARDGGWIALADRLKAGLLLPEQKGLAAQFHDIYVHPWFVNMFGANNQNGCFNWFAPEENARGKGEAASIVQMIETMITQHSLDRSRVYIAGFSAGGAMAAAMLAAYPEAFAGGAIVAGVPVGCARTTVGALRCMAPGSDKPAEEWRAAVAIASGSKGPYPAVTIWHGDADNRVSPVNLRELTEQWTTVHGLPAKPSRTERSGKITRARYDDAQGRTVVESVVVRGLTHRFPADAAGACGQAGDFVADAGICAARDVARFWGLTGE